MPTYQFRLFNLAKHTAGLFHNELFEAMDDKSAKAEALARFDKLLSKPQHPNKPRLNRMELHTGDGLRLILDVTAKDRRHQRSPA